MRFVPLAVAMLASLGLVAAHRPRETDENTLVDNLYLDPTAPGEKVIAKYVTPFDPPVIKGEIYRRELIGTFETWEGRMFLVHRPLVVVNELSHDFLSKFDMVPGPDEDSRPNYLAAEEEMRNNPAAFAEFAARPELTAQEAVARVEAMRQRYHAQQQQHPMIDARDIACGPDHLSCPNSQWCDFFYTTGILACDSCVQRRCEGRRKPVDLVYCRLDIC